MRKYLVEAKSEIFDLSLFFTSLLEVMSSLLSLSTICCDMKKTTTVSYFYLLFGNFFFESLKQDRESASTLFCPFKLHFRVDGSTEEKRGTKDFQEGAFETFFLTKRRMTCLKSWVRKRPLHKHFLFRKSHRNFRYFSYFCKWHS